MASLLNFFKINTVFFLLFLVYFVFLEIAINRLPIHPETGFMLTPVKLILEKNQWPTLDYPETQGPGHALFYLLLSKLVGLNIHNLNQCIVLINLFTMGIIFFHCKKRKFKDLTTICLLILCMFNITTYPYINQIYHHALNSFFLVGGIVFLGNFCFSAKNEGSPLMLFFAGLFLGFAFSIRPQYLLIFIYAFCWLNAVVKARNPKISYLKTNFYFLLGVLTISLYPLFFLIKDFSAFIAMHFTSHLITMDLTTGQYNTIKELSFKRPFLSIFKDFLMIPSIKIILAFFLTSGLICFLKKSKSVKDYLKNCFSNQQVSFQILTLGFAVIIIFVYFSAADIARLTDSINFFILGTIPFLKSGLEDFEPGSLILKWVIFGTLFLYSANFLFSSQSQWLGPYYLWKNKDKMEQHPLSLKTLDKIKQIVSPLVKEGDIVFADPAEIFLELPVNFPKGLELPRFSYHFWSRHHKIPPQLYSLVKILSEKDAIKALQNGKIKLVIFNQQGDIKKSRQFLITIKKYFNIIEKYNSYIVYQLKADYAF